MSVEMWPNLFVIGAGRSGTTSLWHYLGQHPDVFMSPKKEPWFFARPRGRPFVSDAREYLNLFADAHSERYRGEASVSYLWARDAPFAIARASPGAKIVVSLRDPVQRAYSAYLFAVRHGLERRSFVEALEEEPGPEEEVEQATAPHRYAGIGFYARHLERYLRLFPGQVHALFFEELAAAPRREMERLFRFLGVDPGLAERLDVEPRNEFAAPRTRVAARLLRAHRLRGVARTIVPRRLHAPLERTLLVRGPKPPMDERARRLLEATYAAENERLAEMLARPLPWGSLSLPLEGRVE
jgi:hypothetical protein